MNRGVVAVAGGGRAVLTGSLVGFMDESPRAAAFNMALDEALLDGLAVAENVSVLRVYRWERPAVTFGYFEPWAVVKARYDGDGRDLVRRWTGGGVVEHGDGVDWTYSLLCPRGGEEAAARWPAAELYGAIHAALAAALGEKLGWAVELAAADDPGSSGEGGLNACFTRPVRSDVRLAGGGEKVAGAAQRRTRSGLLHQGSVRAAAVPGGNPLDAGNGQALAACFARNLTGRRDQLAPAVQPFPPGILTHAAELVRARYGDGAWTRKF